MIVSASATFTGTALFTARAKKIAAGAGTFAASRSFGATLKGVIRRAVGTAIATRAFRANPIINGCVLEPQGRTMARPYVNRSMDRPYVDRVMARPDTE